MKIRLLAPDSKIPNYAIMKISAYHKIQGDDVDWYNPKADADDTDKLYISKIFTFSKEPTENIEMPKTAEIIKGGTGYDVNSKLPDEIDTLNQLDYSLYPDCDYSIIFTTRGCIRKCEFCVVPHKEGLIHDVEHCNMNPNMKYIMVLDNNFFASKTWPDRLEYLKSFNKPLSFKAGLDLRILTEEQCEALSKCKIKQINVAWDNYEDEEIIIPKLKMLVRYIKPYKINCYILIGFKSKELLPEDMDRVEKVWSLGVYPFVMVYVDFNNPEYVKSRDCRRLARWCNNRVLFKSCTFEDYRKRQGNNI